MVTLFVIGGFVALLVLANGMYAFTPAMGHGGKLNNGTNDLETVEWTLTKRNRLAEITHSGTNGWAKRIKTVSEATFTATVVWDGDTSAQPENDGVDAGDEVTAMDFYIGGSGKQYSNVPLIIETLEISVNNQNGAVMYKISGFSNGAVPDPT